MTTSFWSKKAKNGVKKIMVKSGKKWHLKSGKNLKPLYSFCKFKMGKVSYVCGGQECPHT